MGLKPIVAVLVLILAGCASRPPPPPKPVTCNSDAECEQANLIAGLIWQSQIMGP